MKTSPGAVELTWSGFGIGKGIRIELGGNRPLVRLIHTITNTSDQPVDLAPWVITMFRQGGTVILPQPVGNTDPHGLLHNRLLALWPYTRINDPRLQLHDDFILLQAQPDLPPFKLGYYNTAGWLAYWVNGILFRKSFDLHPAGTAYPDGGCNAETYCNDRFVELESLGPLVKLGPGASTQFTETWELFSSLDAAFIPVEFKQLLENQKN